MSKVWFITGASRGLGRIWTEAALRRGDRVVATARNLASVEGLSKQFGDRVLLIPLDVTRPDEVIEAVGCARSKFGRLDVVVNNAGDTLIGAIEECREDQVRALFDINYFGPLRVIQAVLPLLREQGGGHILGVSSGLGIVAKPLLGAYSATKFAIEALHESLALEVEPFGVRVTLIEPGNFATGFAGRVPRDPVPNLPAYQELRTNSQRRLAGLEQGDPEATAAAILAIVDAEKPPLRFALGPAVLPAARKAYLRRIKLWRAWARTSNAAQGTPRKGVIAPS
ncbi:MAG: SDR family NAD(P)-dependent oxidoreductase [Alphaproteobacteria bacterium]|nr:SDR family NAD(P)-dependent oxidoreductase [Reyranella sp.]MBL6940081.1 SDR family NAD(P)-dependent oxidoreductase [Alphaproteobacteria bacterium]MBL7100168.1 SDR family NAD(P)-dependent oxidoreductase [Alphaproteobacteria bacterium]